MRRLLYSFIKKAYACTRDAAQAQKAGGGGRAIYESPLRYGDGTDCRGPAALAMT